MSNDALLPHLTQPNSWKRLLNERLQHFSHWDDCYQILNSVSQSDLYKARQQLRNDTFHIANVGSSYDMIINTRNNLQKRVEGYEREIQAIQDNEPNQTSQAIKQARDSLRSLIEQYNKQVRSLETSRSLLESQRTALLAPISSSALKRQVDNICNTMLQGWTNTHIGRAVDTFIDNIDSNLQHIEQDIERVNGVLNSIYNRSENNFSGNGTKLLNITAQRRQVNALYKKAANFNWSFTNMFTRKSVLINRFINTVVQDVRSIYLTLNQYIDAGIKDALSALVQNNQYQKQNIENQRHRLVQLEKEGGGASERTAQLREDMLHLQTALRSLEPLCKDIISSQASEKNNLADVVQQPVVSLQEVRQAVAIN